MQLLFIDYTNLVLKAYDEGRNANRLSSLLMNPTTANIRQECLNVYNERVLKGQIEDDILRSFFGVPPAGRKFDYVIERFHPDKFRPLKNFINKKINNPSVITVELLAWLIDFTPRPLAYAQKKMLSTGSLPLTELNIGKSFVDDKTTISIQEIENVQLQESALNTNQILERSTDKTAAIYNKKEDPFFSKYFTSYSQKKKFWLSSIGLGIVICLGLTYFVWQNKGSGKMTTENAVCVYWTGDHYEEVPCNEPQKGRLILTMDAAKAKSFKRITRTDTITEWSIGRIYYIKDSNIIKFYTEAGKYPEDVNRNLKVLSRRIFQKYILKNEIASKDSSGENIQSRDTN